MTDEQASQEAIRRWGSRAWLRVERDQLRLVGTSRLVSGRGRPGGRPAKVLGHGRTWEEAFSRADQRAGADSGDGWSLIRRQA